MLSLLYTDFYHITYPHISTINSHRQVRAQFVPGRKTAEQIIAPRIYTKKHHISSEESPVDANYSILNSYRSCPVFRPVSRRH